jgi:uncharacterized protein YdeI (YjbR/CyaY-like superfamily)
MKPLVDKHFILEKFHGKGGWTYARIPKFKVEIDMPIRCLKVQGTIDGVEIRKYHLLGMGNDELMLPVKAEIRKKIRKEEGDKVHVILYPDMEPLEIPEELLICLRDEPHALHFFNTLSESEQKYYIQWIFSAKRIDTRVTRLAKTVSRLARHLKMYDWDEQ